MRTAVHNVVVELRMLARPLEIRSSPHPIETHGMTALVTAMIPKPNSLPLHPGPRSGFRRAITLNAGATNPEIERNKSRAVGPRSCTASLMASNQQPPSKAMEINVKYGKQRLLDSFTTVPLVCGYHERNWPVILDRHPPISPKAIGLRLYSPGRELLDEHLVEL